MKRRKKHASNSVPIPKRKRSRSSTSLPNSTFASPADAQRVISQYHVHNKQQVVSSPTALKLHVDSHTTFQTSSNITEHQQKDATSALQAYQMASLYGSENTKHTFDGSIWVMEFIFNLFIVDKSWRKKLRKTKKSKLRQFSKSTCNRCEKLNLKLPRSTINSLYKLRLLDVGSITDPFKQYSEILLPDAIDLNPCKSTIIKSDFFSFPKDCLNALPPNDSASHDKSSFYDVVVLSLVLNFVGDPRKRGEMLRKAAKLLKNDGLLFLILPLACVKNSRYFNVDDLTSILEFCGLLYIELRESEKLFGITCVKKHAGSVSNNDFTTRSHRRKGKKRNNFTILFRKSSS